MLLAIRIVLFVLGTAFFVVVSRRPLRRPGSHGFFRFFAFESILCVALLNIPGWFQPDTPLQLFSWALLLASLALVLHALAMLRRAGRVPRDEGSHLYSWESTSTLVTSGAFRYIRHPMYASLLLLAWGSALKIPSAAALGLASLATLFLVFTARSEESENLLRFGDAYRDYMSRSRRFIPFLI